MTLFLHKYVGRPLQAKAFEEKTKHTQHSDSRVKRLSVTSVLALSCPFTCLESLRAHLARSSVNSRNSLFKTVFQLCPLSLSWLKGGHERRLDINIIQLQPNT